MPFTSVVLPVPRSPRNSSNCGGLRRPVSLRPTAIVSALLCVVNSYVLPSANDAASVIAEPQRELRRAPLVRRVQCPLQPNIPVFAVSIKTLGARLIRARQLPKRIGGQQRV